MRIVEPLEFEVNGDGAGNGNEYKEKEYLGMLKLGDQPPWGFAPNQEVCFLVPRRLDGDAGAGGAGAAPAAKPARWTVIQGDCGTGKTSLLRCIAHHILGSSVRGKAPYTALAGSRGMRGPAGALTSHTGHAIKSGIHVFAYGPHYKVNKSGASELQAHLGHETLFSDLFGLLDPSRLIIDWYLAQTTSKTPNGRARAARLFSFAIALLIRALPDVKNIRIEAWWGEPTVVCNTSHGDIALYNLSASYRVVTNLIIDLVLHMHLANPLPDDADARLTPAVVLMDSFGMHLHSSWLSNLTHLLSSVFPATQFVITSHLPEAIVNHSFPRANLVQLTKTGHEVFVKNVVDSSVELSWDET